MHSNAEVMKRSVRLSKQLLEHHEGHYDEILAIIAHEVGHIRLNHIAKLILLNSAYMIIFALILLPFIELPDFLAAFSIYHESYVMTLIMFGILYHNSVDVVI